MNKGRIDLHTHSFYSDGKDSPLELAKLALKRGVFTLAITDHANLSAEKELTSFPGLTLINGTELDVNAGTHKIHIIGYDYNASNNDLKSIVNEQIEQRKLLFLRRTEYLTKMRGVKFNANDVEALLNKNITLAAPHVEALLTKSGYAKDNLEARQLFLRPLLVNKIEFGIKQLSLNECFEVILNAGGIPVLAHPCFIRASTKQLRQLLYEWQALGLMGIEVYHSDHTTEQTQTYLKLANEIDLLISGGSDYHGSIVKPSIELGTGINNNLDIRRLSIVDYINERNKS